MSKNHDHSGCKHAQMAYCEHCQAPYCKDCGQEWLTCKLAHYPNYGILPTWQTSRTVSQTSPLMGQGTVIQAQNAATALTQHAHN